ncbi:MAG: chloride channel protein [Granulosicoccaceae bacterium]
MSQLQIERYSSTQSKQAAKSSRPRPNLRLFVVALLMGVVVGLSTVWLIEAVALVQHVLLGNASEKWLATLIEQTPTWRVVLAPLLGGLVVGVLLSYLPGNRYHGIADVMEACALRGGRMDARSGLGAAAAAAVSIGSGASVGREGPAVHIGASLCAWVAEKMGLNRRHSLVLLGCGAAAAVTASFNAPIAGVLFALEVVVGYYTLRVFAPIVLSAMGAVTVARLVHGEAPAFSLDAHAVETLWELPLFGVLGIVCALLVVATIRSVRGAQIVHQKLNIPIWLRPAIGGLLVGLIALITPFALGVGYQTISLTLNDAFPLSVVLGILLVKVIATGVSLGSGFCGGVFGPSLVIGALAGAGVGQLADVFIAADISSPAVYAMAGMAASASAMLGAPISTVLIVFELTSDYNAIVAVMLASAIASSTMMYQPYSSYFRWQLSQRGVNIVAGRDQSLMRTETVDTLVSQRFTTVSAEAHVEEAISRCARERQLVVVAVDEYGDLSGSMTVLDLVAEVGEEHEGGLFMAYAHDQSLALQMGSSLSGALDVMASHQTDYLPVVEMDSEQRLQVTGVVYQNDVLKKYNQLLEQARADEFGVN